MQTDNPDDVALLERVRASLGPQHVVKDMIGMSGAYRMTTYCGLQYTVPSGHMPMNAPYSCEVCLAGLYATRPTIL